MLNRVILMGRLTAEPDYRTTQAGVPLNRFTLAVDRDYTPANSERQADFIDVVVWRQTAEFVRNHFHKGQLVAVQGRLQVSSYNDKEGNKRRSWDVVADQVYFAEPKRDGGYNSGRNDFSRYEQMVPPPAVDVAAPMPAYTEQASSFESSSDADFNPVPDDDLPF